MSALLKQKPRYNVAAFVEYIRPFPDHERWELIEGEAFLMSPQTERHQSVVTNLLRKCYDLAKPRGCRVYPGLGTLNMEVDNYAPIPDIVVRCGPPVEGGYITDPVLVAEVLSPSTAANDRGRKLDFYMTIDSLRTILIIDPDDRRVDHWTRHANGWTYGAAFGAGVVPLAALDGEIKLSEVYEGLDG
jgi:Uma2 family endonuclease